MPSALEQEIDQEVGGARIWSVEWDGFGNRIGVVTIRGKHRKVLMRREFCGKTEARIFWEAGRAVLAQRERAITSWRDFFERTGGIS